MGAFAIRKKAGLERLLKIVPFLFVALLQPLAARAVGTQYVPVAVDDITIIIPVHKIDCLPEDVCITWTTKTTSVLTSYTDDAGFNYSDDTNKIHRLDTLYYYSFSSAPLRLQCVIDSYGNWGYVQSSSGDSYASVINSTDGNGQPLNMNYGALIYPVYQHRWPGNLLVNATNCYATNSALFAPVTNDWTYKHTQKSYQLRVINPDDSLAFIFPPTGDNCRLNNGAPNLWQRTLDCVGSGRPTSLQIAVDESVTRITNYTPLTLGINPRTINMAGDGYNCSYAISVDGVPKGNWGNHSAYVNITLSPQLRYGQHTIGFKVIQCVAVNCTGPSSNCTALNTVYGYYNGPDPRRYALGFPLPDFGWQMNPKYAPEQTFNFNLVQPSQ